MKLSNTEHKVFLANIQSILPFVSRQQALALAELAKGEGAHRGAKGIESVKGIIEAMPSRGEQEGMGYKAIAHLHYFSGQQDFFITEKGESHTQLSAFGLSLNGQAADLNGINISELINDGFELDLDWTPKPIEDC